MFGFFDLRKRIKAIDVHKDAPSLPTDCEHKHWRARGWNTIGTCTCVDCGAVLYVDDALNATVNRLEQLERRIDEKLRAL